MKKGNKFGAKRTNGFDSKGEYIRSLVLNKRLNAGEISNLVFQPKYYLTEARILYKPDFEYTITSTGQRVCEDYKGMETPVFRLKARLWQHYGPGVPLLLSNKKGIYKTIEPKTE